MKYFLKPLNASPGRSEKYPKMMGQIGMLLDLNQEVFTQRQNSPFLKKVVELMREVQNPQGHPLFLVKKFS